LAINSKLKLNRETRAEITSDVLGNVQVELKFGPNPLDILSPGDTIVGIVQSGTVGKVAQMVPQIQEMLPKLDSILTNINILLSDAALKNTLKNVEQITGHLTVTTHQLSLLTASISQQMPQMLSKVDGVLANTEGLTHQLNSLDVSATMEKVDKTLANVQQLTDALNSNEGTLGLLMRDPQLYNNMNATMGDADKLLIDLKEHPKRYVHFSIFGKKDK
jgi:phospholipid/cholesterol/gamma-HCH transport system substrate-binding protein